MRIPFRRRRIETPPDVAAALTTAGQYVAGGMSHLGALALAAADRGDVHYGTDDGAGSTHRGSRAECAHPDCAQPPPRAEPAVHYLLGREDRLACGAALGPATCSCANPQAVTCGACKRTRIWKTRTSPGATAAPGTTRKQES